jgi:hypothetical protein
MYAVPHGNFSANQSAVASLWSFAPFGILIGWISGFTTSERINAG